MFNLWLLLLAALATPDAGATDGPRLLNPSELVTADDYPLVALRKEEQGAVTVRVRVDEAGTVASCEIVKSSGHAALDEQTCSLFRARARFEPKKNRGGRAVRSSYTQKIVWQLQATSESPPVPRQPWMIRTSVAVTASGEVVDCKLEQVGLSTPPDDCEALMALVRAGSAGKSGTGRIVRYLVSEVYFYPWEVAKAPSAPHLAGATELGREVASVIINAEGSVTHCEGVRYSGGAAPERDGCQVVQRHRFQPAAPGSSDMNATIVIASYSRTQTTT